MPPLIWRYKPNHPEYVEPAMIKIRIHQRALASVFTAALLSAGCATVNLETHVAQTADQALELASNEDNTETAQAYLLRIASRFQDQGNHEAARTLLQSRQLAQPASGLGNQKLLLAMASATALRDESWANAIAGELAPSTFIDYPADLITRAANLQTDTYSLAGEPIPAAMTLILLAQTDNTADAQQIHNRIWSMLEQVSESDLSSASAEAIGYEAQGWLELASLVRTPDAGIDEQGRIIRNWQNNWPGHPAAQVLPAELRLIATLAESRPEKIALALPLEGPLATAGKAIRDGFLAAYYLDDSADRGETDIRIFNTAGTAFADLYKQLSEQDIDLIVGPLEKEALAGLGSMNTLPVPALGLNYLPADTRPADGLYQFGLSAEDEARQIADRLAAEQLRQVLVLIPGGEWGDRVEAALLKRMASNEGVALDIERFYREDNLRAVTADLLGITVSRDRAIQVERTIGMDVEFEPRRRQDADAIVMVAEPTVARQFKPLFAFYFGGDLPVYSPSIIYEGTPAPSRDRDLNGVIFTDIPWVLGDDNELRTRATENLSGTRGQPGRLFAMGADAWHLSKRLPLLRQVESASISGQTGILTMTAEGSIHREQLWAQFRNGVPELIPDPVTEESEPEVTNQETAPISE
ncbi:penicillin-binding protein activator [Marinobacter salsuginis]|uniref:Penicillin-binding protein activator n=1 Tax=Marinobacter salsuginis TaxID=418719 RepID=A0A5M3Q521_9GAMM|nr:penicillin-binding protein activator [Marinobacter salsuginis]GBO90286.1 penicillin-binding protein activator [Marinobacter salsuginis]